MTEQRRTMTPSRDGLETRGYKPHEPKSSTPPPPPRTPPTVPPSAPKSTS